MSQNIDPILQTYFEMLPINVKNQILESDVQINDLNTLLSVVDGFLPRK